MKSLWNASARLWRSGYRLVAAMVICLGATSHAPAALSAVNQWSAIGPEGASAVQIAFHPSSPSIVYLSTIGRMYRSIDGGANWQPAGLPPVVNVVRIAVDPTNGNRVLALPFGGPLYVSTDAAATFRPLTPFPTTPQSIYSMQFAADGSVLYAATATSFYGSTDFGETWEQRSQLPGAHENASHAMVVDPADPRTVIVQNQDAGILISHDGGRSWASIAGNVFDNLAFSRGSPQRLWSARGAGLYVSSDGGVNWSPTTFIAPVTSITAHPSDANVLYVGSSNGSLHRSSDRGVTWTDISADIHAGQISTIAISPSAPEHVMIGGSESVWSSEDSATTWTRRISGIKGSSVSGLSAIPAEDRIYVSLFAGGVHRFDGETLSSSVVNESAFRQMFPVPRMIGATTILAQPLQPDRLLVGTSAAFLRSTNAGSAWQWVSTNPPALPMVARFADSPVDEDLILAGTIEGLYRSVDGGSTWSPTAGLPSQSYVTDIVAGRSATYAAFTTIDTTAVVQTPIGHGIYKSTDGGVNWVPANTGIESTVVRSLALDPSDDLNLIAGAAGGIFRTVDGGATWTDISADSFPSVGASVVVALDTTNPRIVYAAAGGDIRRSVDRGSSWEILRSPTERPYWTVSSLLVDPLRPNTLLAGTHSYGVQHFAIETDLRLEAVGPTTLVAEGASANYRFAVRNVGPYHATQARLTVQLPTDTADITTAVTGQPGSCTTAGSTVTCVFDVVRAGYSSEVDLQFAVSDAGTFEVTSTLAGDQPDLLPSNNAVASSFEVAAIGDVSVKIAGPANVTQGNALRYTMTIANAGPNAASNVRATLQLAGGLTATAIAPATCTNTSGTIACEQDVLDPADAIVVTIDATSAAAGSYANTATVSADTTDLETANNSVSLTTIVAAPPPPPPPPPQSSGGGGGGSMSPGMLMMLMLLACCVACRRLSS